MNDKSKQYDSDIDSLRERYQSLQAPTHLRTRILAHTKTHSAKPRRWRPALVAIPLALAVFGVLLFVGQPETESNFNTTLPSLTTVARLMPARPAAVSPSLGHVRTVSPPPMPRKPTSDAAGDPQTNIEKNNHQNPEEYKYEYV